MRIRDSDSWATLIPLIGVDYQHKKISSEKFNIGRNTDNDLIIIDNPHVSGVHCFITKDPDGLPWLTDCSSNGTRLNSNRIIHNDTIQLQHGDVIHLVKSHSPACISFRFVLHEKQSDSSSSTKSDDHQETLPLASDDENEDQTEVAMIVSNDNHQQVDSTPCDDDNKEPEIKKAKLERDNVTTTSSSSSSIPDFSSSLECSICKEIMHHCVSIRPCIHSFCGACLLAWRSDRHADCPTCRGPIDGVSKNHLVNSLIESYLQANPEKDRTNEEKTAMDRAIQEKSEVLFASSSSSSSTATASRRTNASFTLGGFLSPIISIVSIGPHCRSCHPHQQVNVNQNAMGFHMACNSTNPHIQCSCCNYPMPDLRLMNSTSTTATATVPSTTAILQPGSSMSSGIQECFTCARLFCYQLYGDCPRSSCIGCLRPVNEFAQQYNFPQNENFILRNAYETDLFKRYLHFHNKTFADVVNESLIRLDAGNYSHCLPPAYRFTRSTSLVCLRCYRSFLPNLIFAFRLAVPVNDLAPEDVSRSLSRFNCCHGHECRTQVHNLSHAQRYNHICAPAPALPPPPPPPATTSSSSSNSTTL